MNQFEKNISSYFVNKTQLLFLRPLNIKEVKLTLTKAKKVIYRFKHKEVISEYI